MAVKQAQKFTEEELNSLKIIQAKSQNATLKFGQLYLNKLRLEEQETLLKNHVKEIEQEETKIAQQLSDKYGKGSIDIETGEFTPTE
jgi:hypothetical protein